MSSNKQQPGSLALAAQRVPTKSGTPAQGSPVKRRKAAITVAQKEALIDNLQLESKSRIAPLVSGAAR